MTIVRETIDSWDNGASKEAELNNTLAFTPTEGRVLILVLGNSDARTVTSVTQTGVTWNQRNSSTNNSEFVEIWEGIVGASPSTTITIPLSGNANGAACIAEYSGVKISAPLDKTASAVGSDNSAESGTTATTSEDRELWVGGITVVRGDKTYSAPTNGFAIAIQHSDGNGGQGVTVCLADKLNVDSGTADTTLILSASGDWAATLSTFFSPIVIFISGNAVITAVATATKHGDSLISGTATVTADARVRFRATDTLQGVGQATGTGIRRQTGIGTAIGYANIVGFQDPDSPPSRLILDFKSREELALIGTDPLFKETILLWHHGTVNFDQFKVRFGGISNDSGFFIPTSGGSDNTEQLNVDIQPGELVRTVINLDDLVINDFDPDGERTIRIYVRDKATGLYNSLLTGALEIPIRIYRGPPVVRAVEFSLDEDTLILLMADREFSVRPETEAIPPRITQAADIEVNPIGLITSDAPVDLSNLGHIDGMPEDPTTVEFTQDPLITLVLGEAKLKYIAKDTWGEEGLQLSTLNITTPNPFTDIRCDAGIRFSFPPTMRAKDPVLEKKYLPPWDSLACQFWNIVDRMQTLVNAKTAPLNALSFMFQEIGLVFPGDVAGYPEASLRRLLDNADIIHRTRFTFDGLSFYLSLLIPNITVTIEGFNEGLTIFLNSSVLGLPTVALINTSQSGNDINNYLFGSIAESKIIITITGDVSTEMQEFVRSTIRQEIPYADDPINPLDVEVVFVTP